MMREFRTLFAGAILLVGALAFAPALSQADEIPLPEDDELSTPEKDEVVPDEEAEPEPVEDNPYARNGFYIGLAGSLGVDIKFEDKFEKEVRDGLGNPTNLSLNVDEKFGLNTRAGYRFHPRIAAEVQFEWISEADIDLKGVAFGKDAFTLERWTLMANAKGYLGTGIVQPFLLVGLGVMKGQVEGNASRELPDESVVEYRISETDTDFAARFGGGLEVYATENIVINIDATYVLPTGSVNDFDYVSVGWGFQYRF
jgi:opacity protein-like surface antigen